MTTQQILIAVLATMLTTAAWAQTPAKPLNLKLAPNAVPAASSSAPAPAASTSNNAPGVYYGDTSGRLGDNEVASDNRGDCDDYSYNQPQIHGSVGMGVVGGSHVSGNYQTGSVNLSKAFGSCDRPAGGISISVGTSTGTFHGRGH